MFLIVFFCARARRGEIAREREVDVVGGTTHTKLTFRFVCFCVDG